MTALEQVINTAAFWWFLIVAVLSYGWLHAFRGLVKHNDRTLEAIITEREHLAADRRLIDFMEFDPADVLGGLVEVKDADVIDLDGRRPRGDVA